ncbi:MAG: ABC transporter permease [Planctomycetes bacterium]|nr:ABC transporter permease [Planctomycetota bacterium]
MGNYILRRCLSAPLVLLCLITFSYFMVRLAPGDPFSGEKGIDPAIVEARNKKYHFDQPLPVQFMYYLGNLCRGDLGNSTHYKGVAVSKQIGDNIGVSLQLGSAALILALIMGMGAGIISAVTQNSWIDYSAMSITLIGLSIPIFVIGPIMAFCFGGIFEYAGYEDGSIRHLVLPAFTLSLPFASRIARLTRAGMLEIIHQDFVRTARAKGLSEVRIIGIHVLRGGLTPVIGFLGPAVAAILTGSLVVEKIFQIPGLGRDFVESALNRDYDLVLGTVIMYGLLVIICNLIADIAYGILDPRVRYENT